MKQPKLFRKLSRYLYGKDKRTIFLWGYYVSFIIIMTLAMVADTIIHNYSDAIIEAIVLILTAGSLLYYRRTDNLHTAVIGIIFIATLTTYAYLFTNQYTVSIYFIIVPLGYFLLFSLRTSLMITLGHYLIVLFIYLYGFQIHPDYLAFHTPNVIVSIVLASLLITFFGIVYHLAIENSYQQLANADHQKEILLKEVHHRVKNNLNVISSMLGLQMLREEDMRVKEIYKKNKSRIKSIALVHEILYRHSNFAQINALEYFQQLTSTLLEVCERNVRVEIESHDIVLPFELILKLGIITNELTTNSIKYAFDDGENTLSIELSEEADSYLYTYRDSGTGVFDIANLKQGKSLGLRLIDMMSEQMDAHLDVIHTDGLTYTLRIPRHAD
jgi:two-component sensor histidine kinase